MIYTLKFSQVDFESVYSASNSFYLLWTAYNISVKTNSLAMKTLKP